MENRMKMYVGLFAGRYRIPLRRSKVLLANHFLRLPRLWTEPNWRASSCNAFSCSISCQNKNFLTQQVASAGKLQIHPKLNHPPLAFEVSKPLPQRVNSLSELFVVSGKNNPRTWIMLCNKSTKRACIASWQRDRMLQWGSLNFSGCSFDVFMSEWTNFMVITTNCSQGRNNTAYIHRNSQSCLYCLKCCKSNSCWHWFLASVEQEAYICKLAITW